MRSSTIFIALLQFVLLGSQPPYRSPLYNALPSWPKDAAIPPEYHDKYVFRDEGTSEIVIAFPKPDDPQGARTIYRFRPQNQVDPHVTVEMSRAMDGRYRYLYTIGNGPEALQSIDIWSIVSPGPAHDIELSHPRWAKVRAVGSRAKQAALHGVPDGEYIDWDAADGHAVGPGSSESGFLVVSTYRPGFTTAYAQGGKPLGTRGDLPPEVVKQLAPLMKLDVNNRITVTLGPRFTPDADRKAVANDYQAGLQQLAKAGAIDSGRPFFAEAFEVLEKCSGSELPCLGNGELESLRTAAATPTEKEIANALILALQ